MLHTAYALSHLADTIQKGRAACQIYNFVKFHIISEIAPGAARIGKGGGAARGLAEKGRADKRPALCRATKFAAKCGESVNT